MRNVTLSICIPTFNRGRILAGKVAACLASSCRDFEIVVSDNASDDGSCEPLGSISDDRYVFLRNERNVGAFENQLRAFEAARGKYLMQMTDKDEVIPEGIATAVVLLSGLDAACGGFDLVRGVAGVPAETADTVSGLSAFARYGLGFAHPSGRFFRRDILERGDMLSVLRALPERIRPYSTDYLTTLCLRFGGFAQVHAPLVRWNLPPYGANRKSLSYDNRGNWYFTPEFLFDEFCEYVRFLRDSVLPSRLARLAVIPQILRRTVLPRMTDGYRRVLSDETLCDWYGVPREFRDGELSRDLEGYFLDRVKQAVEAGTDDALAMRLGAWFCGNRIRKQRRRHGK